MVLIESLTHELWTRQAAKGNPPDPAQVMRLQYGLKTPWFFRNYELEAVKGLGYWPGKRRLCLEKSRSCGKSIGVNALVLYAAEYVIPYIKKSRQENRRIKIIGRTIGHIEQENIKSIHEMICEFSPWLKSLLKNEWVDHRSLYQMQLRGGRTWNLHQMDLTNGVSIRGYGLEQSVRGSHDYFTILDDVVEERTMMFGKQQLEVLQGAIEPSVEPGGLILVVGSALCDGDLHYLLGKMPDKWQYHQFPAIDDGALKYKEQNEEDIKSGYLEKESVKEEKDIDCLWPYRLNFKTLMAERGESRSSIIKWEREYMLKRAVDMTMLVHPNDIVAAKDEKFTYVKSAIGLTFAGLDPSLMKGDATGIVVIGVEPNGKRRVLHIERVSTGTPLDVIDKINSIQDRFYPSWIVEANGYQGVIKPLMEKLRPGINMDAMMLIGNKHMQTGWPVIRTFFEAGNIILPYGPTPQEKEAIARKELSENDIDAIVKTDMLVEEIKGIQYIDNKIVEDPRRSNDLVAALFLALRASEGMDDGPALTTVQLYDPTRAVKKERRNPELTKDYYANTSPYARLTRAFKYDRRRRR